MEDDLESQKQHWLKSNPVKKLPDGKAYGAEALSEWALVSVREQLESLESLVIRCGLQDSRELFDVDSGEPWSV